MTATDKTKKYLHTWQRVADTIRNQRAARGLSIEALAEQAATTPEFVEHLERAGSTWDLDATWRVLDVLSITPVALPPADPTPVASGWFQ